MILRCFPQSRAAGAAPLFCGFVRPRLGACGVCCAAWHFAESNLPMLECSEGTFPNALQAKGFLCNFLGGRGGFVIFLSCLPLWLFVPQFFSFAGTEAEMVLRFSLKGDLRFHRKGERADSGRSAFQPLAGTSWLKPRWAIRRGRFCWRERAKEINFAQRPFPLRKSKFYSKSRCFLPALRGGKS